MDLSLIYQKFSVTLKSFSYLIFWAALLFLYNCNSPHQKSYPALGFNRAANTFTSSETCKECHEKEYELWQGSHHDLAMQMADSTTVLANFNETSFTYNGVRSDFFKKGEEFWVNTIGEDGNRHNYKVIYTFGIEPLQQYIVEFPRGSFQCLQTAWDTEENKWFDLQPNLEIEPNEWLHWTGNAMKWNTACADCHSTDLHKNFNPETDEFKTTFRAINVGCEGCHGPASQHVNYYRKELKTDPPAMYMGTNIDPLSLVDKCARCHSRRQQITPYFDYTGHFLDHYDPNILNTPTYELDGQILDEDYVYASFVQSKMYSEGVSCKDCHDMHSLKLKQSGNKLCNNCHDSQIYDQYSHHYHELNTEGAQCVNCHMTGRTYMGNDYRRDHSFRIPRPDQSVIYSTPNSCNQCHTDKSAQWSADFIKEKYGNKRSDHFSDYLTKGYNGDKNALLHLINGPQYPDIARATAIHYFGNLMIPQEITLLKKFLQDTSDLVRNQTIRLYENLPSSELAKDIEPLLEDTSRLVRLAAVRYFKIFSPEYELPTSFIEADKEYKAYILHNEDTPSTQHEKAQIFQANNDIENAISSYQKALEIDNHYNYSRMNLALLYYQKGDVLKAEELYEKVITQEPEISYPYYMLGLLYNEKNDLKKAEKYLETATKAEPLLYGAHYNYLLLLQKIQNYNLSLRKADDYLLKFPNDQQIIYLKLVAYFQQKRWVEAEKTAKQLIELAPNNPQYQNVLTEIQNNK